MKTIVLQGDSITDSGRSRDCDLYPGWGYSSMLSGRIGLKYPGKFKVLNRGIGSDRIVDIYARIKTDIINLKPDILTILIGVNDAGHDMGDWPNGVSPEKFRMIYGLMIEEIRAALPDIKIYILEPFTLKGSCNEGNFDDFFAQVQLRAEGARYTAEKYGLTFVPLQEKFNALSKLCDNTQWLMDGIHPTPAGYAMITEQLMQAMENDLEA